MVTPIKDTCTIGHVMATLWTRCLQTVSKDSHTNQLVNIRDVDPLSIVTMHAMGAISIPEDPRPWTGPGGPRTRPRTGVLGNGKWSPGQAQHKILEFYLGAL